MPSSRVVLFGLLLWGLSCHQGNLHSSSLGRSTTSPPPTKGAKKSRRPPSPPLKVLTFNVNYGGAGMAQATRAILRSGAAVVALQETTPAWERYLRRHLRSRFAVMRFRHVSGGAGGLAFLSRFPLRELHYIPPPRGGWFPAWLVRVATPLGALHLLNVHLHPPVGDSGRISSIPSAYFTTRTIRKREVQHYLRLARRYKPLLILGDFNEGSGGRAVRWLQRTHRLQNALSQFDRKSPTWYWPTSLYTFRARLDHILYSKELRCVHARVLGEAGSDHYPVEATLTRTSPLPQGAAPTPRSLPTPRSIPARRSIPAPRSVSAKGSLPIKRPAPARCSAPVRRSVPQRKQPTPRRPPASQ